MRRLIRKAFGKTLWHGTSLTFFQDISKGGAIYPNEEEGAGIEDGSEESFDGFTFFATDYDMAYNYALDVSTKSGGDSPVIIEVDISEDALLPDDNDLPNAKTWQESDSSIGQVKITGPVTTDYFKTIYFYSPEGNLVGESSFSQWESFYEKNKSEILTGEKEKPNVYESGDDEEFYQELSEYGFGFDFDSFGEDEDYDENEDYHTAKNKVTRLKRKN